MSGRTLQNTRPSNADLREANRVLRRILHHSLDEVVVATLAFDSGLKLVRFSPEAKRSIGVTAADLGCDLEEIDWPCAEDEASSMARQALASGWTVEREIESDRRRFLLHVSPDADTRGVRITLADLTPRRDAEYPLSDLDRQLGRSIQELETLLDFVPAGILIAEDPDCEIIRVNQYGAEMLGVEGDVNVAFGNERPAELPFRLLLDDTEPEVSALPMQRACATGEPIEPKEYEIRFVGREASRPPIHVLLSAAPLTDPTDEAVSGAIGIFLDVTNHKETQAELEQRARRAAAASAFGLEVVGTREIERVMQMACEVVAQTVDLPFASVLQHDRELGVLKLKAGVGWKSGLVGSATAPATTRYQGGYTLAHPGPVRVENLSTETRFQGPSVLSDHGVVSGMSVAIPGTDGPWGVIGAHSTEPRRFSENDVHFLQTLANILGAAIDRHRVGQLLGRARRELEASETERRLMRSDRLASLGTLAAGIAHEIKNPVNSILLTAEHTLMGIQAGAGRAIEPALETVMTEARRCGAIVDGVLQFAKHESTGSTVPVAVNAIVERAASLARGYAKAARADIRLSLDETDPRVDARPTDLEQVVVNLLQNAVQSPDEHVSIELSTRLVGDEVQIHVVDDGPGIPAEIQARIFDPFFSTRRQEGGTGLGLSVAHAIVEHFGGAISVSSIPGKGTRFVVNLPLRSAGVAG